MKILFDIGGTKMRISSSLDGQRLEEPLIIPTPSLFEEGCRLLLESIKQYVQGEKIEVVAGGIAGPLDKAKTMVVNAPNLKDWNSKPLKALLEQELSSPVYLENDAALSGLGEAHFGEGRGKKIVAYLTVSTGVGGVRIIDGKIERNDLGFEPGHQIIQKDGFMCPGCQIKGHLEGHIGGAAIEKRFGKKPEDIFDQTVWDGVCYDLAVGLNNTIVHWSPDVVVLGGSLMAKIDLEKVTSYLAKLLVIYKNIPTLKKSTLGDISGLYGALAHVSSQNTSS